MKIFVSLVFIFTACGNELEDDKQTSNNLSKFYDVISVRKKIFRLAFCSHENFDINNVISFAEVEKARSIMLCGSLGEHSKIWTCCDKNPIDLIKFNYNKNCFVASLASLADPLYKSTNIEFTGGDKISLGELDR